VLLALPAFHGCISSHLCCFTSLHGEVGAKRRHRCIEQKENQKAREEVSKRANVYQTHHKREKKGYTATEEHERLE
jgi:hypothetical protein